MLYLITWMQRKFQFQARKTDQIYHQMTYLESWLSLKTDNLIAFDNIVIFLLISVYSRYLRASCMYKKWDVFFAFILISNQHSLQWGHPCQIANKIHITRNFFQHCFYSLHSNLSFGKLDFCRAHIFCSLVLSTSKLPQDWDYYISMHSFHGDFFSISPVVKIPKPLLLREIKPLWLYCKSQVFFFFNNTLSVLASVQINFFKHMQIFLAVKQECPQ